MVQPAHEVKPSGKIDDHPCTACQPTLRSKLAIPLDALTFLHDLARHSSMKLVGRYFTFVLVLLLARHLRGSSGISFCSLGAIQMFLVPQGVGSSRSILQKSLMFFFFKHLDVVHRQRMTPRWTPTLVPFASHCGLRLALIHTCGRSFSGNRYRLEASVMCTCGQDDTASLASPAYQGVWRMCARMWPLLLAK